MISKTHHEIRAWDPPTCICKKKITTGWKKFSFLKKVQILFKIRDLCKFRESERVWYGWSKWTGKESFKRIGFSGLVKRLNMKYERVLIWGNFGRLGRVLLHGLVLWDLFLDCGICFFWLICITVTLFLEVDPLWSWFRAVPEPAEGQPTDWYAYQNQ